MELSSKGGGETKQLSKRKFWENSSMNNITFIVVKTWKPPKHQTIGKWLNYGIVGTDYISPYAHGAYSLMGIFYRQKQ